MLENLRDINWDKTKEILTAKPFSFEVGDGTFYLRAFRDNGSSLNNNSPDAGFAQFKNVEFTVTP